MGRQAIIEAAKLKGIDGEALAEDLQTFTSSFHSAAIATGIDKSYAQGKALLDKYKGKLEGPDLRKLESELEKKRKADETENKTKASLTEAYGIYDSAEDRADALDRANKIGDVEIRDKVLTKLTTLYNRDDANTAAYQAEVLDEVQTFLKDAADNGIALTVDDWKQANGDKYEALTGEQKVYVDSGAYTITNKGIFNDLLARSVEDFLKININDDKYLHTISSDDRKTIKDLQDQIRKGDTEQFTYVNTINQQLKMATDKHEMDDEEVIQFNADIQAEITRKEMELGRKLPASEVRQIVDDFSFNWLIDKNFAMANVGAITGYDDDEIPPLDAYHMSQAYRSTKLWPGQSDDARKRMLVEYRNILASEGAPVTLQTLIELYNLRKGK